MKIHVKPLIDTDYKGTSDTLTSLFKLIPNGIIAGGFFSSYLKGEQPRDVDIFFRSDLDFRTACKSLRELVRTSSWYEKADREFLDNVATFIPPNPVIVKSIDLVGIPERFGEPEHVISTFDFTINQVCAYMTDDKIFIAYTEDARLDILRKNLRLANPLNPRATFKRALKYAERGFKMVDGDADKLLDLVLKSGSPSHDYAKAEPQNDEPQNDEPLPGYGEVEDTFVYEGATYMIVPAGERSCLACDLYKKCNLQLTKPIDTHFHKACMSDARESIVSVRYVRIK